jgi:polyhydroxyalkanoate synthesis regulator protein
MAPIEQAVTIKRYGGVRLYDTAAAGYVSLGDLACMVEDEEAFVVIDAMTGEDITQTVLDEIRIIGRAGHG